MSEFPPPGMREVTSEVATLLRQKVETISIAETAAGGIISAALLSTPGASKFYKGGLTLYTLESRIAFAGWTQDDVHSYKGPTPAIVSGLAASVRKALGSTYALCESGTAGPTGGSTRNRTPSVTTFCLTVAHFYSGYVALAVATANGTYTQEVETGLGGDREKNMIAFAIIALNFLKDIINDTEK
ncbi:hypothetical protein MMC27_008445 [Xylographa pallens]|nr:hypothetical protein [Xylographa pallens]